MSNSHKKVPTKIRLIVNALNEALYLIDNIDKNNRTERDDELLHKAADSIYEAREFVNLINVDEYQSMPFVGEHIVTERIGKRPRIKGIKIN